MDWIAFDADDTLWKNEETYLEGREVFLRIIDGYGIKIDEIKDIDQIEVDNIPYYGYGAMSFVLSLIEMAIKLTEGRIHADDIQLLITHGKSMLSAEVEVFDGVHPLLASLSEKYQLMLITKGDLFHQQRKISSSGLGRYFQVIEVVSDKSPEVYLDILKKNHINPGHFIMIGNSLRSDILPVLKLGGWAIYLKNHLSWSHEDGSLDDKLSERFIQINDISETPTAVDKCQ
jgi:putative hydrolase of the HAD superfamily